MIWVHSAEIVALRYCFVGTRALPPLHLKKYSAHYPLVAHEGKLCQEFGSPASPSPAVPLSIDNVNEDEGCGEQQRNLSESSFEVKLRPQYFCSLVCQYADWKPHEGFWASEDFWNYPHRPLSISNGFECSAALQSQLVLIHSDPDISYHIAPNNDDVVRFHITDRNMSVSFRLVRDMAIMRRHSECIGILAQTLRAAVEMEDSVRDLEEEYAVSKHGLQTRARI
ncbi:hypothetical protein B0H13DRAFT_1887960 [Mycena leptocephala]|nr:hypothetical protein B0H13DRAFT_1887960 [Mycena leptocephala]